MKIYRFLLLSFLLIPGAFAGQIHEDVLIKVNGMVCDFCAQAVFKVFEDYEGVNSVEVSLDEAMVTVHMKPGASLSQEELDKAITYAGYDLVSIKRIQSDHSS